MYSAGPGVYEAEVNPHGAVSVKLADGSLLGVKPGEFEWVQGEQFEQEKELRRSLAEAHAEIHKRNEEILALAKWVKELREASPTRLEPRITELEVQLEETKKDALAWKREFDMYRRAWLREIGGVIANKTHEIDGFVLRTHEIYEKSRKWDAEQAKIQMRLRDAFYDVPDPGPSTPGCAKCERKAGPQGLKAVPDHTQKESEETT
jgi:hypothetical protein